MKKIVIETKIKQIDGDIEQLIDNSQFTEEIQDTTAVIETFIAANNEYVFNNRQMGIKNLKITSDLPIKISYTVGNNTFVYGDYVRGITIEGGGESVANLISQNGFITLENENEENAHIKIVYTY